MPNEIQEISRAIGKLEGKMDLMVSAMQDLTGQFANLEKGRLSTLEINFAKLISEVGTMEEEAKTRIGTRAIFISAITGGIISIISSLVIFFLIGK